MIDMENTKNQCDDRHCYGVSSNGILKFTGKLRFGEIYDPSTRYFKHCPMCGDPLKNILLNYVKDFPEGEKK